MALIKKAVTPIVFDDKFLNAGDTLQLSITTDASGFASELLAASGLLIQRQYQDPICLGQIPVQEMYERAAGVKKFSEEFRRPLPRLDLPVNPHLHFGGSVDFLSISDMREDEQFDAVRYAMAYANMTERLYKQMNKSPRMSIPAIKKIISSDPVTIVIWEDDTKTIVRRAADTEPSEYTAVCAAICKKLFGSNHKLNKVIKSKIERPKKKVKKSDLEEKQEYLEISEMIEGRDKDETETFSLQECRDVISEGSAPAPMKLEPIELEVEHLDVEDNNL